jgi:hypothetical protein
MVLLLVFLLLLLLLLLPLPLFVDLSQPVEVSFQRFHDEAAPDSELSGKLLHPSLVLNLFSTMKRHGIQVGG